MKHFIPLALFVFVGCGRGPVAESKPEFTSDAELIAWKDGPAEKFKGKVFLVKANPEEHEPIANYRKKCGFFTFTDSPRSQIQFVVAIPDDMELPNAARSDRLIVEFISTEGRMDRGNTVTSLSRLP